MRCKSTFETRPTVFRDREVMSAVIEKAAGSDHLDAIISGDTHNFEVLRVHETTPKSARLAVKSYLPLQIIAGNGGTKLDPAVGPREPDGALAYTCDQEEGRVAYFQRELADSGSARRLVGKAVCSYGYASGERNGDRWTFSLRPFGGPTRVSDPRASLEALTLRVTDPLTLRTASCLLAVG
jgi:hypothetical protein